MPNIDNDTLLACLQSVHENVRRYESLLDSETLPDPENITELLMFYHEALRVLKSLYISELNSGANLPPLDSIIYGSDQEADKKFSGNEKHMIDLITERIDHA